MRMIVQRLSGDNELNVYHYSGETTERWAELATRDRHRSRQNTYTLLLSDGRTICGELPYAFFFRCAIRWVGEGA